MVIKNYIVYCIGLQGLNELGYGIKKLDFFFD